MILQRWQKESRYYEVGLEQDLLNDWVVTRVWGSIGTRNGKVRHDAVASKEAGQKLMSAIRKTRKQHGYNPIKPI
jgi:predicted DNA-binding WGR domain protein